MDPTVKTLFITGITDDITDNDIRDYFSAFGEIKSTIANPKKKCGFVTFMERPSAESAQMSTRAGFVIKGHMLVAHFAKKKQQGPSSAPIMKISSQGISYWKLLLSYSIFV